MDVRVLITGIIVFLALIWYGARGNRQLQTIPPTPSVLKQATYSDPATCRQILACTGYNNTGAKNLYSDVKSRAIPNERLIRAFDIDNSFTTTEAERRKDFNKEAGKAIKMTQDEWQEVATLATELVRQAVSPSKLTTVGPTTFATLDSLVRSVCLKIVLHVLFKLGPLEMDEGDISTIAESINNLWIQSKGTATIEESDKRGLQEALERIIPGMKHSNPLENPMNLIMPAYETLWRVVLSGFLHVTFVKGGSPTWRAVLARFLASPSKTVLQHDPEVPSVSVYLIVKEALRLYPSVKRVFRQFHMDNEAEAEDVAADIETCQRSKALWGRDAEHFVPSRWINASKEARNSYMAFGVPPFVCPAIGEFGPMLIGILVAAFADQVSSEDWHVKLGGEGSSDVPQRDLDKALSGERPLVSDRSTYEGIRIIKK